MQAVQYDTEVPTIWGSLSLHLQAYYTP